MKYNKSQVIKKIKQNGYYPLDFEWCGSDSIIRFEDCFGYKYSMSFNNFNREKTSFKPIIIVTHIILKI